MKIKELIRRLEEIEKATGPDLMEPATSMLIRLYLAGDETLPVSDGFSEATRLRDDFAGQALPAVIRTRPYSEINTPQGAKYIAETSYHLADAMLAARGRS